jgi:hypothetical protein
LSNSPALKRGSFKKACSLALSMNELPVLLMFRACPVPDHSPGNLCRYARGTLRSCKWMWGALPGWFMSYFISINPHVSWHPYHLDSVMFCHFHCGLMDVCEG